MAWVQASDRLPGAGVEVQCRLRHFSGDIQEHRLVKVDEDDCAWRTAGDLAEISYSWDVIEWRDDSVAHASVEI